MKVPVSRYYIGRFLARVHYEIYYKGKTDLDKIRKTVYACEMSRFASQQKLRNFYEGIIDDVNAKFETKQWAADKLQILVTEELRFATAKANLTLKKPTKKSSYTNFNRNKFALEPDREEGPDPAAKVLELQRR